MTSGSSSRRGKALPRQGSGGGRCGDDPWPKKLGHRGQGRRLGDIQGLAWARPALRPVRKRFRAGDSILRRPGHIALARQAYACRAVARTGRIRSASSWPLAEQSGGEFTSAVAQTLLIPSFAQSTSVRQKGEPTWGEVSWASDKTAGHTESFSFQVPSCLVMQTFYRFGKQIPAVLEGRKITLHFLVMLCVSTTRRRKAQIDGK